MAQRLQSWRYKGWPDGYNNYSGSKSTIKDQEFPPPSMNVMPADKGSVKKSPGAARFGGEVNTGYPVLNGVQWITATLDYLIVHSGTVTKRKNGNSWVTMTGATWDATKPVYFCPALDRLYACQDGGSLYYTTDGSTWNLQSNGKGGRTPVFTNQRLYVIDTATGYIWYSNPYSVTTSPPAIALSNFGTFDTDLTATPKKNAGFIQLMPGAGVVPTRLILDNEVLYVYTKRHGYWKITAVSTLNSDGSLAHVVSQANGYFGTVAPFSVGKVGNDQWFDDGQMLNSLGEVALYQNVRVSPKFGRVKADLDAKNTSYLELPALGVHDNTVYYAYPVGTYNDRVIAFDTVLGACSSPWEGYNCAFFMEYFDGNVKRLLYGSSKSTDSYVYEMDSGLDIAGSAVDSIFEPKSTDCGYPGRVKRLADAKVYYSTLYGTISWELIYEESRSVSGTQQVGNSTSLPVGLGSLPLGSAPLGQDYDADTTFASLASNSFFKLSDSDAFEAFEPFERVTIRITNAVTGESYQIDDIEYIFQLGSQFEELD